jgi:hypothetical protein
MEWHDMRHERPFARTDIDSASHDQRQAARTTSEVANRTGARRCNRAPFVGARSYRVPVLDTAACQCKWNGTTCATSVLLLAPASTVLRTTSARPLAPPASESHHQRSRESHRRPEVQSRFVCRCEELSRAGARHRRVSVQMEWHDMRHERQFARTDIDSASHDQRQTARTTCVRIAPPAKSRIAPAPGGAIAPTSDSANRTSPIPRKPPRPHRPPPTTARDIRCRSGSRRS